MKKKTIFDIKVGDPVWILLPGIVNRFDDGVVSFPSVHKTKVVSVSCVGRDEKGTSVVEIVKPSGIDVPSLFSIDHDSLSPHFEMAIEYVKYVTYDDNPYFYFDDIERSQIKILCLFDKSVAKEKFKEETNRVEDIILNWMLSARKRIKNARKNIKDIRKNFSDTLRTLKE